MDEKSERRKGGRRKKDWEGINKAMLPAVKAALESKKENLDFNWKQIISFTNFNWKNYQRCLPYLKSEAVKKICEGL